MVQDLERCKSGDSIRGGSRPAASGSSGDGVSQPRSKQTRRQQARSRQQIAIQTHWLRNELSWELAWCGTWRARRCAPSLRCCFEQQPHLIFLNFLPTALSSKHGAACLLALLLPSGLVDSHSYFESQGTSYPRLKHASLQPLPSSLQSPELRDALRLLPLHIEPPRAWRTLEAGLAAHGASALRQALAPRRYPIPSWGSLAHCRCQLAPSPAGRRFRARPINACLALVFEQLPAAVALAGLPPVQLSRWDLHHGHLFFEPGCGRLGLLLHAKEYPAWEAERFEVHLGHCQQCGGDGGGGSPLRFDEAAMDTRNYLW